MPPSLALLMNKVTQVFTAIRGQLDGKLDKSATATAADRLANPIAVSLTGDVAGTAQLIGDDDVNITATLAAKYKVVVGLEETLSLQAGEATQYTLDLQGRDLNDAHVILRVLDSVPGSPTMGSYINSEGVAVYGLSAPNVLKVVNQSTQHLNFYVYVSFDPRP